MVDNNHDCSVCGTSFEVHFRYQCEVRQERSSGGEVTQRAVYFCSQRCLEASHHARADGLVTCDACTRRFQVDFAAQVLFTGGRRHYACSNTCRAQILEGARAIGIHQLEDPQFPGYQASSTPTRPASVPSPAATPNPTPAPAPNPARASAPAAAPKPAPVTSSAPPNTPIPPSVVRTSSPPAPAPLPSSQAPNALQSRVQRPQVLAVFNHKGGTGKTTTAVHMAAGLAARGCNVLLVDTDGQGNVATSLGLNFERSLYHTIVMGLPYRDVVIKARPCLDVVPSNETLAAAELYIAGQRQRDRILAHRFQDARASYDYVVVDCSPSLSLMNQNALVMADAVLCPVACDYLSIVGVQKVVRTIKQVNRLLAHPLGFWGVLPTFFDTRARICHEALETLREHFQGTCLAPVRLASKVKEAPAQGKTLFEYAPGSSAALDYLNVVDRLIATRSEEARGQDSRLETAEPVRLGGVA